MSSMSEKARSDMKAKAGRLVRNDPSRPVDASGYKPPGPLNGDVQVGMRPISRRNFRSGGKVSGHHAARADRAPRKSGGLVDEYMNRNEKEANMERVGTKNVGALARGGAAHGKECSCAGCRPKHAGGGSAVLDGGTRPVSGRLVRKSGGRTKAKTNVNIIITQPPARPAMPPPGAGAPMGGPPGMHVGAAPPAPPANPGAPSPMMGAMPRRSGGRAYPIKDGAGSGEGRLQKTRSYGIKP